MVILLPFKQGLASTSFSFYTGGQSPPRVTPSSTGMKRLAPTTSTLLSIMGFTFSSFKEKAQGDPRTVFQDQRRCSKRTIHWSPCPQFGLDVRKRLVEPWDVLPGEAWGLVYVAGMVQAGLGDDPRALPACLCYDPGLASTKHLCLPAALTEPMPSGGWQAARAEPGLPADGASELTPVPRSLGLGRDPLSSLEGKPCFSEPRAETALEQQPSGLGDGGRTAQGQQHRLCIPVGGFRSSKEPPQHPPKGLCLLPALAGMHSAGRPRLCTLPASPAPWSRGDRRLLDSRA